LKPRDFRLLRRALLKVLRTVFGSDVLFWIEHAGFRLVA
jgi:hypothetical protein